MGTIGNWVHISSLRRFWPKDGFQRSRIDFVFCFCSIASLSGIGNIGQSKDFFRNIGHLSFLLSVLYQQNVVVFLQKKHFKKQKLRKLKCFTYKRMQLASLYSFDQLQMSKCMEMFGMRVLALAFKLAVFLCPNQPI